MATSHTAFADRCTILNSHCSNKGLPKFICSLLASAVTLSDRFAVLQSRKRTMGEVDTFDRPASSAAMNLSVKRDQ